MSIRKDQPAVTIPGTHTIQSPEGVRDLTEDEEELAELLRLAREDPGDENAIAEAQAKVTYGRTPAQKAARQFAPVIKKAVAAYERQAAELKSQIADLAAKVDDLERAASPKMKGLR